jgi:sulfate adenylyltransferase
VKTASSRLEANGVSDSAAACLWLTGLSGAGKTTTARAVIDRLARRGCRAVLLDGDELRRTISSDLGFSRQDRDTHVMRVAALAREIAARNEIVICALVSPYRDGRERARRLIGSAQFIEVFIDAPIAVCEARDPKGLYAKARRGEITGFTGIDDPYEAPISPDVVVTTAENSLEQNADRIVAALVERGCLARC